MNIELGTLRPGRWRRLREDELAKLEKRLANAEQRSARAELQDEQ
jgi:16S rRNA U516 pseudouridylate synthase RsuA-like enzyme